MKEKRLIINDCLFCKKQYSVTINQIEYQNWISGQLIQNAMPNVSASNREFLISKICPTCQDNLYNPLESE